MSSPDPARPASLKRTWRYTLEVVTPLHIGAGGDALRQDTDYVVTRSDVVVIDPLHAYEKIYAAAQAGRAAPAAPPSAAEPATAIAARFQQAGVDAGAAPEPATGPSPADVLARLAQGMTFNEALAAGLLTADDLKGDDSIVRYRLKPPPGTGAPLPHLEPPQILPLVRDAHGRAYVPGSSLKGALRTVLAAALFGERTAPLRVDDVVGRRGPNPRAADDRLEGAMFGPDPNHDLLRTLLVGDSSPADQPPALAVSGTYSIRQDGRLQFKPGFFVALEVLPAGARLAGTLRLDLYPFSPSAAPALRFGDPARLADFPARANAHAAALIAAEIPFYREHGLPQVAAFYETLQRRLAGLGPDACLLQISWGAGWLAKTFGPALRDSPAFPAIRDLFRPSMNRRPGAVFPKTRRLTLGGQGYASTGVPLGWVELRLEEA